MKPAKPSPEKQFLKNILRDQRAIWTFPFHLSGHDAYWLVPLGAGTSALIATDRNAAEEADELNSNSTRAAVCRNVSRLGTGYMDFGIAGTFYLVGRLSGNTRARETGLLAGEALIDSGIVVEVLKLATQRRRPGASSEVGDFFEGGNSFPSGHSITAWTLATVIAQEYGKHRWVAVTAYSLAALVGTARYAGHRHFPSDVLVGSAIGYGIGRYVYRKHHDPDIDADSSKVTRFDFSPHFRPSRPGHASEYGLTVGYNF